MKAAIIVFPGSNCDTDCFHALQDQMKISAQYVWHKDKDLPKVDLVVLPGGFSYGDYLRTGSIARFSPILKAVQEHASSGRLLLGICNGFQILLEAGLLPGAMLRNKSLSFVCEHVWLRVDSTRSAFTQSLSQGDRLRIPIAHGEGNYYCDDATLKQLQDQNRIVFRYVSENGEAGEKFNPNGSRDHIAGIINERGNILGMMPHPERSTDPVLGTPDGRKIWQSLLG